jgi:hypothetical protein
MPQEISDLRLLTMSLHNSLVIHRIFIGYSSAHDLIIGAPVYLVMRKVNSEGSSNA